MSILSSKQRLVVMISGSGTNLQAILDAIAAGALAAEVVLVVSNRQSAYGLVRAQSSGIPSLYRPLKPYREVGRSRAEYDADLAEQISHYQPDLIVLAGWMHVLSSVFLDCFPGQVINLHPALPDTFAGTHAIERAFAAFQRGAITHSGCIVHYVIPEVDAGPVIATAVVPIYPDDSLEEFETRMHTTEHRLMVEALGRVLFKNN